MAYRKHAAAFCTNAFASSGCFGSDTLKDHPCSMLLEPLPPGPCQIGVDFELTEEKKKRRAINPSWPAWVGSLGFFCPQTTDAHRDPFTSISQTVQKVQLQSLSLARFSSLDLYKNLIALLTVASFLFIFSSLLCSISDWTDTAIIRYYIQYSIT